MKSIEQQIYEKNKSYYNQAGAGQLQKDAAVAAKMQRAYTDPLSSTKGNAMASAMKSLNNNEMFGAVTGARVKEDLAKDAARKRTRARLSSLKGDDLNDELKRMEAMMPRRI